MPKAGSIRFRKMRPMYSSANYALGVVDEEDIDEEEEEGLGSGGNGKVRQRKGSTRRRGNLPPEAVEMMTKWLIEHADYAYPTEEEKKAFCVATGLTLLQVNNWFINARRRILRRYLKERGLDHTLYTHSRSGKKQAAATSAGQQSANSPATLEGNHTHTANQKCKSLASPPREPKKSDLRSWMEHNYNGASRLLETSSDSDSESDSEMGSSTTAPSSATEEIEDDEDFSAYSPDRHQESWNMSPPSTDTDASDSPPRHHHRYWDSRTRSQNKRLRSQPNGNPNGNPPRFAPSPEPTPPPSPPHSNQNNPPNSNLNAPQQLRYQLDGIFAPNDEMRALLCVVEAEHRSMVATGGGDGFLNRPIAWL